MLFIAVLPLNSFAAEGDTISFTSREVGKSRQFTSGDLIGVCCQPGVDPVASGSAVMENKYGNSQLISKVAYYYGYRQDWVHNYDNLPGFGTLTYAAALMSMIQACNVGLSNWKAYARDHYVDEFIEFVETEYNRIDGMTVNVPSDFEVYRCNPADGSQDFVVWGFAPTGKLKLKKASSNPSITG